MAKLDELYAAGNTKFTLPENCMTNADLSRLINSDEVQSVVNAPKTGTKKHAMKKNPLKNFTAMKKLNPYAKIAKALSAKVKSTKTRGNNKEGGKKFFAQISADSDYQGEDFEVFSKWLSNE